MKPTPIATLLAELNTYRAAVGDTQLSSWKASRPKLLEALEAANTLAMKTMDPLDIPAFLDRKDPRCYINQMITPEIQARIDAAKAKVRTEVVGSSFARIDALRTSEKKERVAKTPRPERVKKTPPPADSFHLTSLGEGRLLRAFARTSIGVALLKPYEITKYVYHKRDEETVAKIIRENSKL